MAAQLEARTQVSVLMIRQLAFEAALRGVPISDLVCDLIVESLQNGTI